MEWGKLYASLPANPRVQAAEANGGAAWLLIQSMCYCTSAESDGFIPHTQVECFGGPRLRQRVAALLRERLWIPVEGGYEIDPTIWNEERNLSDRAERKREADRERMRTKRAAAHAIQNGQVSRDCRATCSATPDATTGTTVAATEDTTCSRDSRPAEKRREDLPTDVVSHPEDRNARGRNDDDDKLISAVVGAVLERTGCLLSDADARAVAEKVLARAAASGVAVHRPARYVAAAIANEPDPFSLLAEPPPLAEILPAQPPSQPALCGKCHPQTRMREDADGRPYRCPECHPNTRVLLETARLLCDPDGSPWDLKRAAANPVKRAVPGPGTYGRGAALARELLEHRDGAA